jgi:hypothetical protein
MPTAYKVLGQLYPTADTASTLYTVPSATQTVVSTLTISNLSTTTNDSVSIAVRPAGETLEDKHYVLKDDILASGSSLVLTIGMTLATTDVVTVKSLIGNSAFNLFGSEIS